MRILYVDIDSMRPDHLGCYGYQRNTSPTIDSIARESTRFTNIYTSDAPCLPSRTALWSGRNGYHTGVVGHGGTASQPYIEGKERGFGDVFRETGWMSALKRAGLRTATISSFGHRHSAWHWYAGFDEIHNTGKAGMETADEINRFALAWIEQNASEDDWFLHLNYWDPHTPYRTPKAYGNPFADDPLPDFYTQEMLDRCLESYGTHSAFEPNHEHNPDWETYPRVPMRIESLDAAKMWVDGYDVGVRYMDDHLNEVVEALKHLGVYDDLIVIISADHGENLGELNVWGDHQTADQFTSRVPLIVRMPGVTDDARVDDGLHYHYDWGATLVELVSGIVPENWDGQSFGEAFRKGETISRPYVVVSQNAWSCQRSVRFENFICIRTYHDGLKEFDPVMLFDLDFDPHEEHNIAEDHPELVARAMSMLAEWEEENKLTSTTNVDPMMTVLREGGPFHTRGKAQALIARLEAGGMHAQADRLRAKHG